MDINDKHINKFTKEFDELVSQNKLNIDSLENIMIDSIENYEKELRTQVEELLKSHINEKELVIKKNENGKQKDLN